MVGRTLKQFRVEEILGKGGMGTVYRAVDTRLQRPVALKVLTEEYTADADRRARFLREARAAGAVIHPAIAQVYDVDEVDGVTFIAMELVDGSTVRELITRRELDLLGALEIGIQISQGLVKAHEAGIVHRDIKADNVMVTRDGHAKLLDFGLAKLHPLSGPGSGEDPAAMETLALTQAGMVLGTLAYMSPEQARDREVDHRSDIFSLGVVIYQMVTGEMPFAGSSPLDTLHAIAFEETRPVTTIRANLPPSLQRVVARCLRKRPEDRFEQTSLLVEELKAVQQEVETGISRPVRFVERIRERFGSLSVLKPEAWIWPLIGVALATLAVVSILSDAEILPLLFFLTVVGLFVWRRIRNRDRRMVRKFSSRARKMPEVRLVAQQGGQIVVSVDRAMAKTYVRLNAMIDRINNKRFFGDPFTLVIRDDLAPEELRELLRGVGVQYVREDVPMENTG